MTLPFTLTPTVHLQRNTRPFFFPLLLLSLSLWHWMRPHLPFLSAASNAILKPGGLLRWKVQLVKHARLLLPLTEVMKIVWRTSPFLNAPRQSSPRPRLRHGRWLALLFHSHLTQKLYTLFFALSLAFFPRLPNFPNCSSPRSRLRSMLLTWDLTFLFLSQRLPHWALPSYVLWGVSFVLLLFLLPGWISCGCLQSFLVHCHWPRPSCLSYAKASSSLWHGFPSSNLKSLLNFAFLSFHLKDIFYYFHSQDGKASRLSCFLSAYLTSYVSKLFERIIPFCLLFHLKSNSILSLARPVSALGGLH